VLEQDFCGCGNQSEEIDFLALAHIDVPQPVVLPDILTAPRTGTGEASHTQGQAYIDFPINQIVIYPDYMRNSIELARLTVP
jgi:hypothetical protein